jgi:CobQ-like glutamine amidotransferase family enzyme
MKKNYALTIGWLYPELMSTYGDRGNIIVLQKRCEWRGIDTEVKKLDVGFDQRLLANCQLLFMGGAQDTQQTIVEKDLRQKSSILKRMIEDETPTLLICGAYQMFGNYYKEADGTKLPGLEILDLYTENPGKKRLIGNISAEPLFPISHSPFATLVGFENHGGRTYLGKNVQPLGKVVKGFGNNGKDSTEGAQYKNTFGTYLHGPILPKNPKFADLLIKLALEKKYKTEVQLKILDDKMETNAREAVLKKIYFS